MTGDRPAALEAFLACALDGDARTAVDVALGLLDGGIPEEAVITDLLAPAQREVGAGWYCNELTVADEHLATGVAQSALHAVAAASAGAPPADAGFVVVACAEGDWHAIAADMLAQQLRARGVRVAFLGASTPADHVAAFLGRQRPDALAVSCNMAPFYRGVARLADAAHGLGVPVLAGGRALQGGRHHARCLGADGWAADVADAAAILADWRDRPPVVAAGPTPLDAGAVALDAHAAEVADAAFAGLAARFPGMGAYDARQLARTREDLEYIVRFVAAAQLVGDDAVLTVFLDWLAELLSARAIPAAALTAGVEALRPLLSQAGASSGRLGELALAHLSARA